MNLILISTWRMYGSIAISLLLPRASPKGAQERKQTEKKKFPPDCATHLLLFPDSQVLHVRVLIAKDSFSSLFLPYT